MSTKKSYNNLIIYTDQKVYENTNREVTGTMVNDLVKAVVKSTISEKNIDPDAVTWEPGSIMLLVTNLILGANSVPAVPTIDTTLGAIIAVKYKQKIYHYELQESTEATQSPNYIRPTDYNAGTNKKVWHLIGERYKTFTSADLVDGIYTFRHGLDESSFITVNIISPNGDLQNAAGQIQIYDQNIIKIDFGGAIEAGTWKLIINT